jgi:hypothetical protein
VTGVTKEDYNTWGHPSIHAVLFDKTRKEFCDDFVFAEGEQSWHFMNPTSPGWTSALAMAEAWSERIYSQVNK